MEYKKYEYPSYNLYTVKTNKFKTCQMEIIFRDEINKDNILAKTFLADIMTDCSSKLKTRKEVVKKLEELYQANFYGVTNKVGNVFMTSFILSFLNPKYANNEDYLENVLKLGFDMILNPAITASEFDIKNFKIVKNRLQSEILSINENISRVALKKALSNIEGDSASKISVLGSLEELEEITPKKLAETYQELITKNKCDIFIVGNLDMDKIANLIFKYFKNPVIKTRDYDFYVENKSLKKVKKITEKSNFLETSLVHIYSLENLTPKEKLTITHFYNYLLGGGGLNTKLYQLLREKNSLCYGIKSMYLKYDNLLVIETSISKKNVNKASRLIKEAFKEMAKGDFTLEELNAAQESFIFSINLAMDNPAGILNNYVFHIYDNLPLLEERIKLMKDVTKEEIVKISTKIKPYLNFVLEGEETNGSN